MAITADDRRDLSSLVEPGMRAVTVRAKSGGSDRANELIRPGDRVDVVVTTGGASEREPKTSRVLMQNVLVLAVGLDTGSDSGEKRPGQVRDSLLTLSLTIRDAQMESLAAEKGRISVALRHPDDVRVVDGLADVTSVAQLGAAPARPPAPALPTRPTVRRARCASSGRRSHVAGGDDEAPARSARRSRVSRRRSATAPLRRHGDRAAAAPRRATAPVRPSADDAPAQEDERRPQTRDVALAVGESRTISAVDVANYSEGTPGIIDVKLTSDASQFVVVGLKPGSTSLLLIGRDGKQTNVVLNVFARSPEQVASEVTQLIDGYTGVRVRRVGARFFIEGGVSNEVDLKRIEQLAKLYPGQVESLVGVGAGAADRNTNIRIDVYFVQYEKDSSYNVGISWPAVIGGASLQSNVGYDFIAHTATVQAAAVNQPLPGLDIATTHGWAKVLKQATVITTNGVEAKLGNGGEQNFSVANGLTSTIRPISFGTTVTVVPRFDPQTRDLEVKVDADVSDLTPSISGTSLPGRQTANLTTLVHLKLGQSLVLSGIHTFAKTHSVTGIPILSEIPVLGVLFGGHSDSEAGDRGGGVHHPQRRRVERQVGARGRG